MRVALIAVALAAGSVACGQHQPRTPLHVTWRESEGHPACTYDASRHAVAAKLVVTGDAGRRSSVTVTVTAYADENTSVAVGSTTRRIPVHGTVHEPVDLTVRARRAPHVDEDGVAACRLAVG